MSTYQYHEFCRLYQPINQSIKKEMRSLSSRAAITTHGASYVYNYGSFRGNPKALLLKYFDIYLYTSNFDSMELMFKYKKNDINCDIIESHVLKDIISYECDDAFLILFITLTNYHGNDYSINGDELLIDLLPLYEEIKQNNYQFLSVVSAMHDKLNGEDERLCASGDSV